MLRPSDTVRSVAPLTDKGCTEEVESLISARYGSPADIDGATRTKEGGNRSWKLVAGMARKRKEEV